LPALEKAIAKAQIGKGISTGSWKASQTKVGQEVAGGGGSEKKTKLWVGE